MPRRAYPREGLSGEERTHAIARAATKVNDGRTVVSAHTPRRIEQALAGLRPADESAALQVIREHGEPALKILEKSGSNLTHAIGALYFHGEPAIKAIGEHGHALTKTIDERGPGAGADIIGAVNSYGAPAAKLIAAHGAAPALALQLIAKTTKPAERPARIRSAIGLMQNYGKPAAQALAVGGNEVLDGFQKVQADVFHATNAAGVYAAAGISKHGKGFLTALKAADSLKIFKRDGPGEDAEAPSETIKARDSEVVPIGRRGQSQAFPSREDTEVAFRVGGGNIALGEQRLQVAAERANQAKLAKLLYEGGNPLIMAVAQQGEPAAAFTLRHGAEVAAPLLLLGDELTKAAMHVRATTDEKTEGKFVAAVAKAVSARDLIEVQRLPDKVQRQTATHVLSADAARLGAALRDIRGMRSREQIEAALKRLGQ